MEGHGVDREDGLLATLTPPMTLEGILGSLCRFPSIEILHSNPPLYGAERVAGAVWMASYAPRLMLQRGLSLLLS